jgi:diguanylate cyclase (GGDEF)-like protein
VSEFESNISLSDLGGYDGVPAGDVARRDFMRGSILDRLFQIATTLSTEPPGLANERSPSSPPFGRRGQRGRYLLLSGAVIVFAACLILGFNKAVLQHEAALRDAGASLRIAFLADQEMQQLRYSFDLFALGGAAGGASGGNGVDRETLRTGHQRLLGTLQRLNADPLADALRGASANPAPRMIEDLVQLEPALQAFQPGDPVQHAELAARLADIAAPLHNMVTGTEPIGLDETQRAAQRRWLYLEEVLYLLGMLGSSGVFIAMLVRESHRTRRLLAEATDAQMRIEHLAHHDPLTDLPNRWLFKDRLDQALRLAHRHQGMVAMHCVDVDHFKAVNDRYGHVTGDKVLIAVAKRMQACLRQSDTLARLGGDEFAIVQTGPTDSGATHLADRLLAAFQMPLHADGQDLTITVSIGIALYPAHATTAEALHRAADTALYCAKAAGRNRYHLWQPGDDRADRQVRYRAAAG